VGGKEGAPTPPAPVVEPAKTQVALPANFASQVMGILKQMLQLFKEKDTPTSRQKLQGYCKNLVQLGAGVKPWQELVQVSYKAIANPKNSFPTLAPLVIKELKEVSDRLQAGKGDAIAPSPALQKLAGVTAPTRAATATPTPPKQITVPVEPKAAAKAIIQAFDKQQLTQLAKLLVQATRVSG
jgi:hypothetical protein